MSNNQPTFEARIAALSGVAEQLAQSAKLIAEEVARMRQAQQRFAARGKAATKKRE